MHRGFVLYSEPIRFVRFDSEYAQSDGKSVNRRPPVLDFPRGCDSKGAWPIGTRMPIRCHLGSFFTNSFNIYLKLCDNNYLLESERNFQWTTKHCLKQYVINS